MTRVLVVVLLCLVGCSPSNKGELPPPSYRVGAIVKVKADDRIGEVIMTYPSVKRQGQTEYLVKFKANKPKRGQAYITEGFTHDELDEQDR